MSGYVVITIILFECVKTIKGNRSQIWRFYKIIFFPRNKYIPYSQKLNLLADENEFSVPVLKILASSYVAFTSSHRKCNYRDIS
jgi:hypothetical protein